MWQGVFGHMTTYKFNSCYFLCVTYGPQYLNFTCLTSHISKLAQPFLDTYSLMKSFSTSKLWASLVEFHFVLVFYHGVSSSGFAICSYLHLATRPNCRNLCILICILPQKTTKAACECIIALVSEVRHTTWTSFIVCHEGIGSSKSMSTGPISSFLRYPFVVQHCVLFLFSPPPPHTGQKHTQGQYLIF